MCTYLLPAERVNFTSKFFVDSVFFYSLRKKIIIDTISAYISFINERKSTVQSLKEILTNLRIN